MSAVADFYIQAMKSDVWREKFSAIIKGKNVEEITDDQLAQLGNLAREMGFDITLEEAKAYLASEEAILSDEAMDAVAGGVKADSECKGENAGIRYINKLP